MCREFKKNPDVHIICGKCGCATMMEYEVVEVINDNTDKVEHNVHLYCGNCSTITGLDELILEKNKK